MRSRIVFVTALTALLCGALPAARQIMGVVPGGIPGQTPTPAPRPTERQIAVGTSSISGTVLTADSERPIKGARVMVSGSVTLGPEAVAAGRALMGGTPGGVPGGISVGVSGVAGGVRGGAAAPIVNGVMATSVSRSAYTDANGEFSFPRMPAGRFTITVYQNQFLQTNYGERRSGGQGKTLTLTDGQQMTLKVPMLRGGVISGVVRGPDGEPQGRMQVNAWRFDTGMGFRQLQQTGYAETDDRGVYRMYGLRPGDYIVAASTYTSADRNIPQAEELERAIATGKILPPAAPGYPSTVSVPIPAPSIEQQQQMMQPVMYLPTYAPSEISPSAATPVTINGGDEVPNINIVVRQTQATNIQGIVSTPLDPAVNVQVALLSEDTSAFSPQTNSTRPDPTTGKFNFQRVAPGKYTVFAITVPAPQMGPAARGVPQPQQQPTLTDEQKMWGKTTINVAGEPSISVDVQLRPSRTLSGMVVFEMKNPPDLTRTKLTVAVNRAPSRQQMYYGENLQAQVGPDGRFTITGVSPGRYIIRANGGGFMKSSMVNGQDTLDFPVEVTGEQDVTGAVLTMTDTVGELSGSLTDGAGKPASDYMIIIAASESRYWTPQSRRVILTRPSPDGKYTVRGLPSGSYMVAAVADIEQGAQYDPEFLKSLGSASIPVMILEGGKIQQDLRIK